MTTFMTTQAQIPPLSPMPPMHLQHSGAILLDVERQLRELKATRKASESSYTHWQQIAAAHATPAPMMTVDNDCAPLVGALLTGLLDMLLGGLPVMQTLAHVTQGAVQIAHAEQANTAARPAMHNVARINDTLNASQRAQHAQAATAQKTRARQMEMLQQMTLMLMMDMLSGQDDGKTGSGDEGMVAHGPLDEDLTAKRFKQNVHSLSCIRTMFARESVITVPQVAPLRRYAPC